MTHYYVNTDSGSSGNDGLSPDNAKDTLKNALNVVPDPLTDDVTIHCKGTAEDTTATGPIGYTLSGHTITIKCDEVDRHSGVWTTSKYRLSPTGANAINFTNALTVSGLQISVTGGASGILMAHTTGTAYIDKCIIKSADPSANTRGIFDETSGGTIQVTNCIVYDFSFDGIYTAGIRTDGATMNVYNCTVHNCKVGYMESSGTLAAFNCGAASCTTGFGTGVAQTTCSDSSPTFLNEAGDNFHLDPSDTTWRDQGTDESAVFTDDIDGQTRTGEWDIGADDIGGGSNKLWAWIA